jgi:ElaA protein
MQWKLKSFEELTPQELYGILRLRSEVFVVEQDCVYLDADGYDDKCLHLWAQDGEEYVACTRILPPGVYYEEASIGRVIVAKSHRGGILGKELMRRSEEALFALDFHGPIKIMAQSYLLSWYGSQGYEARGEDFLEDGIPHRIMVKKG